MKKLIIISLIAYILTSFACGSGYAVSTDPMGAFGPMGGMDMNMINNAITGGMGGDDEYLFGNDENASIKLIKSKKEKFVSEEEKTDTAPDGLFEGDDTVQSVIYNSVLTQDPRTMQMGEPVRSKTYNSVELPVFKRTRIKLVNWLRNRDYKTYQRDLAREKAELEKYEKELEKQQIENDILYTSKYERKSAQEAAKKELDEVKIEDVKIEDETSVIEQEKKVVKLKGNLKQNKGENVVVLDAKNLYYVEEDDEVIAENQAVARFPKQKITLRADRFIYSNSANVVKAIGNVKITYSGRDIFCDNIQVNINEEEISFEKLNADFGNSKVVAQNGISRNNTLYLYNGYLSSDGNKRVGLPSRKIKGFTPDRLFNVDEDDAFFAQPYLMKQDKTHFDTEKIIINSKHDHDVISLKDTKVRYGDNKVFTIPSLTAYMDKQHKSFEANYPEFGSVARLGMYLGPGFVFEVPRAGTLKFIPFVNYRKGKVGVGGALRYHSAYNLTELYYGSSSDIWIMKGHQKLDDKLSLEYGMNYFMDQWFLGGRMPKYALELRYKDSYRVPNTLKKGLNLTYTHLGTLGYYHNSMYNMNFERFDSGNIGTFRGRYMSEIRQELYKYQNPEHKFKASLNALMQGSAAVYGTGDTQFIGRLGLNANTQYKYWRQNFTFYQSAWEDNTPMKRFDAYRYGASSLQIIEAIRLCKLLSVAWTGMLTLSGDSPNDKLFQENAFLLIFGPEDIKFTLGYDFVRKRTYLTFGFSLNTTGSTLDYKTLEIKNPDKLSNDDGEKIEELQPEFWLIPEGGKTKTKPLQYAKVIDISDTGNKERID